MRQVRSFNGVVRMLMVQQFTINTAFYMLMPYLAAHLADGLGMAAWAVGLVLGVRNLSQQGLFLIGGTLTDRLGCKRVIVAGCALRTAGFAALGFGSSLPLLVAASAMTGFAGALFNPAVRAYLAAEAGEQRVDAFAAFNVFYQAGMFAGPLVGLALLAFDFRAVCVVAAALFAVLTAVQVRMLPDRLPAAGAAPEAEPGRGSVLADWRQVISNRPFLLFSAAMIGSYVLSFQVYLSLPLQAQESAGRHGRAVTSALFAVSALVAAVGQVRITAWAKARWSPEQALTRGLAVMGAAFAPLLLAGPLAGLGAGGTGRMLALVPLFGCAVLLALGTATVYPFEMDTVVSLARGRLVATHYGLYNTVSGVGIALANPATGALWDASHAAGHPAWLWSALTATGLLCALGMSLLARTGRLHDAREAQLAAA
ncbi:MFS transporter [Streptacidiphilus griseoplanus]|uniref:MFS transporter n=1 Tax=Peterkaempfera griseoplana TaxID=66896 RepID=UPI0006E3D43D|nr:MFS transporter [Peterkaempfera griseoplana]